MNLLTLSVCETAIGGQQASGQEIEGLGTLAQKKGAKGVIATLWSVADESTGQFMQHFYRLRKQGLTKAEALRQDQPEGSYTPDPGAPYAHPYYWAPFILMGNWL